MGLRERLNSAALADTESPRPKRGLDGVAAGQVGKRARQIEHPVKGAVVASPYQLPHIARPGQLG